MRWRLTVSLAGQFCQQYPDLRVSAIRFDTNNVFDPELPEENRWHQRLANRLHVLTRETGRSIVVSQR
ncbi:MAG: hypothetical protein R3E89_11160 [Thiolinea sp.]